MRQKWFVLSAVFAAVLSVTTAAFAQHEPSDVLQTLREERARYGTPMTSEECVDLLNRVAWKHSPRWVLNNKDWGAGWARRYDGAPLSEDTLIDTSNFHIYDVLGSAPGAAIPQMNDLGLHTQSARFPVPAIPPRDLPQESPRHIRTKLGATLFSLVDLYQHERARLDATVTRLVADMGVEFLRVFWRKGTGAPGDYWNNEPYYSLVRSNLEQFPPSLMREVMEYARQRNIKLAITLFADNLGMTRADEDRFRDASVAVWRDYLDVIEYIEVFNEPYIYGGGHGGRIEMLRHHARALRAALGPDVLISLGTPQAVHMGQKDRIEQEVYDMYGGLPEANLITVHFSRDTNNPQLAPELPSIAPLNRANSEPIGPDSSVRETKDPAALAENFRYTQRMGYGWYVFHADDLIRPRGTDIWKREWWPPIAQALREAAGRPSAPETPVEEDRRSSLLSDELLQPDQYVMSPSATYMLVLQGDGNLVLYNAEMRAVWSSETTGSGANCAVMQGDGNFVLYRDNVAVWSTNTYGNPGARLEVQDDGNVVIYSADQRPLWASQWPKPEPPKKRKSIWRRIFFFLNWF